MEVLYVSPFHPNDGMMIPIVSLIKRLAVVVIFIKWSFLSSRFYLSLISKYIWRQFQFSPSSRIIEPVTMKMLLATSFLEQVSHTRISVGPS